MRHDIELIIPGTSHAHLTNTIQPYLDQHMLPADIPAHINGRNRSTRLLDRPRVFDISTHRPQYAEAAGWEQFGSQTEPDF